jgi:UDP-N-acetylmuramoyl-tripeptide--D-alanyl-D-alanine ligase
MTALSLADLYQSFANQTVPGAEKILIRDVVIDSRRVSQQSLFVALKGESRDGHAFISDALSRGAIAIIAEERARNLGLGPNVHWSDGAAGLQPMPQILVPTLFVTASSLSALQKLAADWRKKFSACRAIGVTGSVGKSSTKELIASVLRQRYIILKSEGNLNNEIGLPLALLQLNDSHERAVLEMGTYARGEIRDLCAIARPRIGVVTNVGPVHLERLGSIENIAAAKAELIEALPEDGCAILNGDDPLVRPMGAKTRARPRQFFYGLDSRNDLWADEIESHGLEGIAFTAHYGGTHLHLRVPLLGRHSVHTALAAASVGLVEGLSWDEIARGLRDAERAAQLRLIAVQGEKNTTILDDSYNSSPASALAALNLLSELGGRKVAVLGDMLELGSYERKGHELVGGRAAQVVDLLIAVGARGEWIGDAAHDAGLSREKIFYADGNARAVEILRKVMEPGDVILVKGSRGAAMEGIVAQLAQGNGQ